MSLLTEEQIKLMLYYVGVACERGHGEVRIRVVRGVPRFISLALEQEFNTDGMQQIVLK